MKKLFSVLLVAVFAVFAFVSCSGEAYEIALVTDVGNIDDKSFNEGAYNGVKNYAEANDVSYAYYRPTEDSNASRVETIENAIDKGAKVVVCPGYLFETAIYEVQGDYPEVAFLLLDGEPNDGDWGTDEEPAFPTYETKSNVHNILYQEEQSGFLAGYAAVKDGFRELGYVGGMAVPAVIRFGYGFVQGAEYAANELGLAAGDVNILYYYANAFAGSDALETKMDGWYAAETEVVFGCGGKLYTSLVAAAESYNTANPDDLKWVIGVDVDQKAESDYILTSAMKGLTVSVEDALAAFYDNDMAWPDDLAGVTSTLGADVDGVGLPTVDEAWRFRSFTLDQYNSVFALLVDGTIVVSNSITEAPTVTLVTVDYEA